MAKEAREDEECPWNGRFILSVPSLLPPLCRLSIGNGETERCKGVTKGRTGGRERRRVTGGGFSW